MKKILFMIGVIAASMQVTTARAQAYMGTGTVEDDPMIFNHLSAGVNLGTDGWGLEVAAPLTRYVTVRTGLSSIPKIGFTIDNIHIHKKGSEKPEDISLDFKLKMTNWKLLFDVHPFKTSSFRVTFGAFIGGDELLTADYDGGRPDGWDNSNPAISDAAWTKYTTPVELGGQGCSDHRNQMIKVGEKWVSITDQNWTKAALKVNNFKPYVGIGFGRAVKSAPGLSFNFDAGVQFWGKPKVYGMVATEEHGIVTGYEFKEVDIDQVKGDGEEEADEAAKWISKLKVWPTISFRLTYTIF